MLEKLIKHFGKEWFEFLKPFLLSDKFEEIGNKLIPIRELVTPDLANVFRCFKECPFHKLHTIIVNPSPYPYRNYRQELTADGLALSARKDEWAPVILEQIYSAINETIYDGTYEPTETYDPELELKVNDLDYWAKQGILLLNCSLTTIVGHEHEHLDLWRPFVEYLIKSINDHKDAVGFILMGSHPQSLQPLIVNPTNQVFTCEHPMAANYYNRKWRHGNCFKLLNNFQVVANNIKIKW